MLVARIKCSNRREKRLIVRGGKNSFTYKGTTYHVDPSCIYGYTILGLMGASAIDYVQGDSTPIPFYSPAGRIMEGRKNLNTISMIVKEWIDTSILQFKILVLILLCVAVGLGVGNLVLTYLVRAGGGG